MRKILFQVHLWVGLILSLPFLLLGLSGAILVFDQDVIGKMNEKPALHATAGPMGSLDAIGAAALQTSPELRISQITAPTSDGAPADVRLSARGAGGGRPGAGVQAVVSVDPVNYAVLGSGKPQNNMFMPVHFFHEDFLLGPIGRQIVGWSGVGMFFMGLSGLWLWWPRNGRWGRAFTMRKGAKGFAFNYDLHRMAGIWMWLIFVVVTATGAYISFPELRNLGQPAVTQRAEPRGEAPAGAGAPITLDAALATAKGVVPDARLLSISPPARPTDPLRIVLAQPGWTQGAPSTTVTLDATSGEVISVRDPRKYSALETFQAWARPAHEGIGLGIFYKILVFLSGFLPPLFVITGLTMWLQKRKNKAAAEAAENA